MTRISVSDSDINKQNFRIWSIHHDIGTFSAPEWLMNAVYLFMCYSEEMAVKMNEEHSLDFTV